MSNLVIANILAVLPVIYLLFWFVKSNTNKRTPIYLIFLVFIAGSASTSAVILVEWFLGAANIAIYAVMGRLYGNLFKAFAIAGFVEELAKLLVILFIIWKSKRFTQRMDAVVYGAAASLGFAFVENVLYVSEGGIMTAVLRGITAVPLHAICGALSGSQIGEAKFIRNGKEIRIFMGLSLAVLVHGTYDFLLFHFSPIPVGSGGLAAYAIIPLLFASYSLLKSVIKDLNNRDKKDIDTRRALRDAMRTGDR